MDNEAVANLPPWLRDLIKNVNLADMTKAITNVTLADFKHLIDTAKGRELNADTVKKLFDEAKKLPGAGTVLTAAALVVSVIIFCFPMALATPFLSALGFTSIGPAAASLAATFNSVFGVNALFSLLQSAAMAGYGAPVIAGVVQAGSAIGAGLSAMKLWAIGNGTSQV